MEPISIAAGTLGAKFLEEAIKFLWSEAGKILDRYHKRAEQKPGAPEPIVVDSKAPAELGLPERRNLNVALVEKHKDQIRAAMRDLSLYATGTDAISASNTEMLSAADALQRLIVEVYDIDAPGLRIASKLDVDTVEQGATAIGVDAAGVTSGSVQSEVKAKTVKGAFTGVKIDNR